MTKKDMLRDLVLEDCLELDLDDLEKLLGLFTTALATKAKQGI